MGFIELDLTGYNLYSIVRNRRAARVSAAEFQLIRGARLWHGGRDRLIAFTKLGGDKDRWGQRVSKAKRRAARVRAG